MMLMRFAYACALAVAVAYAGPSTAQKKDHSHAKESHFNVTRPADVKAAWRLITSKVSEAEKILPPWSSNRFMKLASIWRQPLTCSKNIPRWYRQTKRQD